MRRLLTVAASISFSASAAAQLPPSLDRVRIQECAPASVDAATECLKASLSDEDVAVLAEPRGSVYRPELHRLLYDSWRLADAATPLAADLRRLRLYYPGLAPSLIVMNLVQRAQGQRPNWRAVAAALRREPMLMREANNPPFVPPSATRDGILLSVEECAAATNHAPSVESCVRMPDGSLITRTADRVSEKPDAH